MKKSSVIGSAAQRCLFIQDHLDRNSFKQLRVTPFAGEAVDKGPVFELRKYLRRNPPANVESTHRFGSEGEVSGLSSVDRNKQVQRLGRYFRFLRQCRFRDYSAWIFSAGEETRDSPIGANCGAVRVPKNLVLQGTSPRFAVEVTQAAPAVRPRGRDSFDACLLTFSPQRSRSAAGSFGVSHSGLCYHR